MRLPVEGLNFKKFCGSSFLSDFTLVIETEASAQSDKFTGSSGSDQGLQQGSDNIGTHLQAPVQDTLSTAATAAGARTGADTEPRSSSESARPSTPCSGQFTHTDDHDTLTASTFGEHAQYLATDDGAIELSSPSKTSQHGVMGSASTVAPQLPSHHQPSSHQLQPGSLLNRCTQITNYSGDSNASSSLQETVRSGTANNNPAEQDASPVTMPVHAVVLAASSPYFETLLRGWKGSSNRLHMVVAEGQVVAAQVLLRFMYSSSIPSSLPQHDLLQLLLLADRFDVRRVLAAASRVLGCLSPAALEWSTLTGIWSLPDHLFEADEQAPVRVVAWDRLMQLFGDLEDTWSTADGRNLWQQLPYRAVAALVASDALAVAGENTVFTALSSWIANAAVHGSYPRQPTAFELRLLAASVRLPFMGPCYLSYVALQHEWFGQNVDMVTLARSAAFAAASNEVKKDLLAHTAATTSAAMAAAAADGSSGNSSASGGNSSSGVSGAVATGTNSVHMLRLSSSSVAFQGDASGSGLIGASNAAASNRCICCEQRSGLSAEQQAQLLARAQSALRLRATSCRRACSFQWHVDLGAIKQLHAEVAAAGSRDSRILRSPTHSFTGYEWALQLEITQTRGATGFDGSKPWALGVFLTCQVRLELPSSPQSAAAAAAPAQTATAAAAFSQGGGLEAGPGEHSSSRVGFLTGLPVSNSSGGSGSSTAYQQQHRQQRRQQHEVQHQQQQGLSLQLVDFGFVSTAATISIREVGGKDKRCEKSWEHAVVRYRASWGWPNYLDVQATGWDDSVFDRWVIDGQMHLTASVKVLG